MTIRRTTVDLRKDFKSEFITQDDKNIYHTQQNVQPVIDQVKVFSDNTPGKTFRHAAEIPWLSGLMHCARVGTMTEQPGRSGSITEITNALGFGKEEYDLCRTENRDSQLSQQV